MRTSEKPSVRIPVGEIFIPTFGVPVLGVRYLSHRVHFYARGYSFIHICAFITVKLHRCPFQKKSQNNSVDLGKVPWSWCDHIYILKLLFLLLVQLQRWCWYLTNSVYSKDPFPCYIPKYILVFNLLHINRACSMQTKCIYWSAKYR